MKTLQQEQDHLRFDLGKYSFHLCFVCVQQYPCNSKLVLCFVKSKLVNKTVIKVRK